jgi:hypothetical protein
MLNIFTLMLDGEPHIRRHLPEFEKLTIPWRWVIVEGVAKAVNDTGWCRNISPRLSVDGAHEYVMSISTHPNVRVFSQPIWEGKTHMVKKAMSAMDKQGVCLQCDVDEYWAAEQLERIYRLFIDNRSAGSARFYCRYFLGPDIIATGVNQYGNKEFEWERAWRFTPGDAPVKHEPPIMRQRRGGKVISRDATKAMGLVFDHWAYSSEKTLRFKEDYYFYNGAVAQWKALQENKTWPVRAGNFLSWIKDDCMADKIKV